MGTSIDYKRHAPMPFPIFYSRETRSMFRLNLDHRIFLLEVR